MSLLSDHRRLLRYATVAAIVLVIGGLFVQREFLAAEADVGLLETTRVEVGSSAPDFALRTPDGDLVRLSDYRGKTVVLNFWATWCLPCRTEMPEFQRVWEERREADDLVILAVDVQETDDQVQEFFEEFDLTFPAVIDRSGEVAEHYGLRGLPGTFFIDRDGIIRSRMYGPVFGDLLPEGIRHADEQTNAR